MDNPTFKLEGIVKTKNEMEDFEGPLTLILQLLSKNKIEIKDISVSLILDQYLNYLEEMAGMDLEIASEFVAMASHLLYIKTRTLVSSGEEEVSELEQLISSLEDLKRRDIYVLIKEITEQLSDTLKRGGRYLTKPPEYFQVDNEYKYIHEKDDLFEAISRVLERHGGAQVVFSERHLDAIPKRIIYSVTQKASEIITHLKDFGVMRVSALFSESGSRSEVVATFIALLELCKQGSICLAGSDDDDLTISYTGTGQADFDFDFETENNI